MATVNRPEPTWVSRMALDAMQLELIREHGGSHGVRDGGLIDSALARRQHKWACEEAELPALAAAYGFGLAKNHGYIDGNKRIAFMAMFVFLYQNGLELDAPEPEAVVVMTEVAAGDRSERALAEWLRTRTAPLR